jgi:hypothetical protein
MRPLKLMRMLGVTRARIVRATRAAMLSSSSRMRRIQEKIKSWAIGST